MIQTHIITGVMMYKPNIYITVERKLSSFDFIFDKNFKPTKALKGFKNRIKNNFGDVVKLTVDGNVKFEGKIQSVANHPSAPDDGSWSLNTGTFMVSMFQDRRTFNCDVHGIGRGYTKKNWYVSDVTFDVGGSGLRYLFHDDQRRGPGNQGLLDSGAYSEGCLIQPYSQYLKFNETLIELGLVKGDIIPLYIVEI